MNKLSKSPLAYFLVVLIGAYFFIDRSNLFEGFVVLILAFIVAKQIEIINLHDEEDQ